MSKITTHILDTAKGCPAAGVRVILYRLGEGVGNAAAGTGEANETEIARGLTNKDGRIVDWADAAGGEKGVADAIGGVGVYKLRFETATYFDGQSLATFYPFVEIHFQITTDSHYHIPLLISPFGYSTYRGS